MLNVQLEIIGMIRAVCLGTQVANSIFSALKSFLPDYGYFPLDLNTLFLFLSLFAFSHHVQLQAALTCQFCMFQSTGTTAHGDFSQITYAEYNLCCFSPSGNAVKHRRLNFVQKCFTARSTLSCKYKAPPQMFDWLLF